MRLAAIGSREWKDYFTIRDYLAAQTDVHLVISGGAKGADTLVELACCELKIPFRRIEPRADRPSPQKFHERNDKILHYSHRLVAFWDGKSRGTLSVIRKANERGIPVDKIVRDESGF